MPIIRGRSRGKPGAGARAAALALAAFLLGACAATTPLIETLSPKDRELMRDATQQALEKNPIGQGRNWINPETGRRGTATPLNTHQTGPQPCREYQMTLTHGNQTDFAYYSACRNKDGRWVNQERPLLAGSEFAPQRRGYAYERDDFPPHWRYRYYDPWYDPWYGPHFRGHYWRRW